MGLLNMSRAAIRLAVSTLGLFLVPPSTAQFLRGVNLAGAEFGEHTIPGQQGTHYTFNSEASYEYFASKGFQIVRLPIRWERLQPQLFGGFAPGYLQGLRDNLTWAENHGILVIIDIHNYARYKEVQGGTVREFIIDNVYDGSVKVPAAALADVWVRLSQEFRAHPALHAYGIMNEPHDMGQANWKQISQAVVNAIRNAGDDTLLLIPGDSWSSAARWEQTHVPTSWILDPADNFAYEAHQYFDADASGVYANSYDQELASDPDLLNVGARRLAPFVEWCRRNNVRGFLGEFGVPRNDPRWLDVLDHFLDALDDAGMDGAYWAAGEWWGDYQLSVHPTGDFLQDRPQMAVLLDHLGSPRVAAVSAASFTAGDLAPESLATLFGSNLATASAHAPGLPLPTSLAGVEVEIEDQHGLSIKAPLLYASAEQINILVPGGLALGNVSLRVLRQGTLVAAATGRLSATAPGLFAANGNGLGAPAAQILRFSPAGAETSELAAEFDSAASLYKPRALRFGEADRLFLVLYGTGLRGAVGGATHLRIGGSELAILYIGKQMEFPGLDQINVELPRALAGSGTVEIQLEIGGKQANSLTLLFE
jgi:endoglucanase